MVYGELRHVNQFTFLDLLYELLREWRKPHPEGWSRGGGHTIWIARHRVGWRLTTTGVALSFCVRLLHGCHSSNNGYMINGLW